jgi:hypothetical protein
VPSDKDQSTILNRIFDNRGGKEYWLRQWASLGGPSWSSDELTEALMAADYVTASFGFWADRDPLFYPLLTLAIAGLSASPGTAMGADSALSVWDLGPGPRGLAVEQLWGAEGEQLPTGYKTFDFFDRASGVATSTKSMDLRLPGYQANPGSVLSTLKGYVNEAADFSGYRRGGVTIRPADVVVRNLDIAIPTSFTNAQTVALLDAWAYGASRGVNVRIGIVP